MNREDTIRMARESCDKDKVDAWHNGFWTLTQEELERFAALVRAAALEEAAGVVEQTPFSNWFQSDCAAAIRARSNT